MCVCHGNKVLGPNVIIILSLFNFNIIPYLRVRFSSVTNNIIFVESVAFATKLFLCFYNIAIMRMLIILYIVDYFIPGDYYNVPSDISFAIVNW